MNSITKTNLSSEQINALVKRAFGDAIIITSIESLEDGWFNSIYSISMDNGKEVVLKISPKSEIKVLSYEKDIMNTEVQVMQLLKQSTDIPVPEIYFYDKSRALIDNEFYFMEKMKGVAYNKVKEKLSDKQKQSIENQLGCYNMKINKLKRDSFGSIALEEKRGKNWCEVLIGMVKDVLRDGKEYEVKLPFEYEYIEDLFIKHSSVFQTVVEPRLVHWDLHDGNVFVNETFDKITGIIDFERAFYGDPLIEFYFGQFCDRKYFVEGYGEELINSKETQCRRILYDLYLDLIMTIESKYRKVDDERHLNWTYSMVESDINKLISLQFR